MDIAVIGAGAIGSVVAGLLTKSGHPVDLIGREDQVSAIKENGLKIKTPEGENVVAVPAMAKLTREYDLVIFTVKTQDIEDAYYENHTFLDNRYVLTTQNGVQADNLLSSHFDPDKVISSIVMFGATYINPGEVTLNFPGDWIIGKPYTMNDEFVYEVESVMVKAFPTFVTQDIMGMKWLKLFVNFNNCIPALIGKSMQETFADIGLCKLSMMLLKEGIAVINRVGIELKSLPQFPVERIVGLSNMPIEQGAEILQKTLTSLSKEPLYGSILQSIMRNKASEIDFINGEIAMVASGMLFEAPLNRKIVDMVHQVEQHGKFWDVDEVKKEFNLSAEMSQ